MPKLALTCWGGVGTVTGANFLLEIDNKKILVDCGLLQGLPSVENTNAEKFDYDPAGIDYLFITHAHIDHIALSQHLGGLLLQLRQVECEQRVLAAAGQQLGRGLRPLRELAYRRLRPGQPLPPHAQHPPGLTGPDRRLSARRGR